MAVRGRGWRGVRGRGCRGHGCGRMGPGLRGRQCGPAEQTHHVAAVQNPESSPDPARSREEPPEQRPEASWLLGASGCPDEVLEEAIQEERDK